MINRELIGRKWNGTRDVRLDSWPQKLIVLMGALSLLVAYPMWAQIDPRRIGPVFLAASIHGAL
jgi:hypothetical protein